MAPHNNYRCKGNDKWVSIAIGSDEEWRGFCKALGNPPWTAVEKFITVKNRLANQDELDRLITEWTINFTHYEVTEILQKAGVAAAPCLDMGERFQDPHFGAREAYVTVDHPMVGTEWVAGIPTKLSKTPGKVYCSAPLLGQHNDYIFKQLLEFSDEDMRELINEGVIG
jgi:benzylsuccinate CoA-transferase BbsF subunit